MTNLNDSLGRVGGISVADTVLTVAVAGFVSQKIPALKNHTGATILGAFVLGELAHLAFKVKTPVTDVINGN
jgi:NAD(P)H-hydrate repair Nnr-like enzyme with NAD(P)H-hydrate dehydratase domain